LSGLTAKTVVDFLNFCREVCSVVIEDQSEPIGGVGKVVEIDESKFGKRKYNRESEVYREIQIHQSASLKLSVTGLPPH